MSIEVYRRHFVVRTGPLIPELRRHLREQRDTTKAYLEIAEEIGASTERYHAFHGRLVAFEFPDRNQPSWFKRTNAGYYPKKNCKEGRALDKRIRAITTPKDQDLLAVLGLGCQSVVFSAHTMSFPAIAILPQSKPVGLVSVPWFDFDSKLIAKARAGEKTEGAPDLRPLFWQPSEHMTEVKRWEIDRLIDRHNSRVKASAA